MQILDKSNLNLQQRVWQQNPFMGESRGGGRRWADYSCGAALRGKNISTQARSHVDGEAEIWRRESGFKGGKLSAIRTRLKKKEQIGAGSLQRLFSSARWENDTFSMC